MFSRKTLTQLTDVVLMVKELDKIHEIIKFHTPKVKFNA